MAFKKSSPTDLRRQAAERMAAQREAGEDEAASMAGTFIGGLISTLVGAGPAPGAAAGKAIATGATNAAQGEGFDVTKILGGIVPLASGDEDEDDTDDDET